MENVQLQEIHIFSLSTENEYPVAYQANVLMKII